MSTSYLSLFFKKRKGFGLTAASAPLEYPTPSSEAPISCKQTYWAMFYFLYFIFKNFEGSAKLRKYREVSFTFYIHLGLWWQELIIVNQGVLPGLHVYMAWLVYLGPSYSAVSSRENQWIAAFLWNVAHRPVVSKTTRASAWKKTSPHVIDTFNGWPRFPTRPLIKFLCKSDLQW